MNKFKYVMYATLAIALPSVASFAQAGGTADNESTVNAAKAIGGGIGFGNGARERGGGMRGQSRSH